MTFYEAHVLVMNTLARLFGGLALVARSFFLVSAYAIAADRWTDVLVGLLLIAIGVAVFVAKPVTVETIANIRRRMGRPDK
jgi:amino acid permease